MYLSGLHKFGEVGGFIMEGMGFRILKRFYQKYTNIESVHLHNVYV
jgi:hypothetical protein